MTGARLPCRRGVRGFSLLELLVAIGLLAVLVGAVYAFIVTLFDREARALDEAARSQTATMVFDRLESDLMSAVATGPGGSAGFSGARESITIAHRSVMPGSDAAPWSDAQATTIRFDARQGLLTLERVESDGAVNAAAGDDPLPFPVTLRAARFRFHDGNDWRDAYRSTRSLPAAVELAIWFGEVAADEPDDALDAEDGFLGDDRGLGSDPLGAETPFDPNRMSLEELAGMTGGFDNEPLEEEDLGQPDRVRVITIPDARVPRAVRRAIGGTP